jgi:two-component system cell cycle sensor histidine kinase/response regulator CckA
VQLNYVIAEYLESPEYDKLKLYHSKVELATDLETGLLPVKGSPTHLSMTIMNLVSNATESMPAGGKIFIASENRYIDRPLSGYDDVEEGDYVVLTVSDTGLGISAEDMDKIFDPFYTKKIMGKSGTGLGMAVVWGTMKDHRGYIDIQSIKGKGTTFTLYFPVTREAIANDNCQLSIEDLAGKGESILIVDDVAEQREVASKMLIKLGYSTKAVSSGEAAVDYIKGNTVDLLVLDMIMDPGIDGLETYKRILDLNPGQKAVIASGFSETDQVKEAQRLGAGTYIKKPYTLERLGTAVGAELSSFHP